MDMNSYAALIGIVVGLVVAAAMIFLLKKRIITTETVEKTGDLLESIDFTDNLLIERIAEYARLAVFAVEQLAKNGKIQPDGASKKQAAMDYVTSFAKADNIDLQDELKDDSLEAVSVLIEAAVMDLPKNQQ